MKWEKSTHASLAEFLEYEEEMRQSSIRMAAMDEADRQRAEAKRDADHAEAKRLGAFNPQLGIDHAANLSPGYAWIVARGD